MPIKEQVRHNPQTVERIVQSVVSSGVDSSELRPALSQRGLDGRLARPVLDGSKIVKVIIQVPGLDEPIVVRIE